MRINSTHTEPVFHASKGHHKLALAHPHTAPRALMGAEEEPRSVRRSRARAMAKAARTEARRTPGFLQRLATEGTQAPAATPTTGYGRQW